MRKINLPGLILGLVVTSLPFLEAQTIPTITLGQAANCELGWDQIGTSLNEVSTYIYASFNDGATVPTTIPASCSGASSPFLCKTALPIKTVGTHTVAIQSALLDGTLGGISATFTYKITGNPPLAPANLRLITN